MGRVYTKHRPLHVLNVAHANFRRDDIIHLDQACERLDQLVLVRFTDAGQQQMSGQWRAGKSERLQQRDLAARELNVALHVL